MSLLPSMGDLTMPSVEVVRQTSRTYHLNLEDKRIAGHIDRQEAARQAVRKILMTEQDAYAIYGQTGYGIAIDDLVGKDLLIVKAELKRRITERLLADDRVTAVHSFSFANGLDDIHVKFICETIYGLMPDERRFAL